MDELWCEAFLKSCQTNKQLISSKNSFVSYIKDKEPRIEMLGFKQLMCLNEKPTLFFVIDKRHDLMDIPKQQIATCFYFPLSREKYIFKCDVTYIINKEGAIYIKAWNEWLTQEEKNDFTRIHPNTIKNSLDNNYNSQDIETISDNFRVLGLTPINVEQTLYRMPHVIADGRVPKFESDFKPYHLEKKYIFTKTESKWKMNELNP